MARALLLPAILLLALSLRALGLSWGLPDERHLYSYHPDEHTTAVTASRIVMSGDLHPGVFNYGSLGLYLPAAWLLPAWHLGLPREPGAIHLWLRVLPVLLGTLTVLVVARLGERVAGRTAGAFAALAYAVAPGAVLVSHFATVDTQANLFLALALLAALRHLQDGRPTDLVWAGVLSGLAAATKYPNGLVLLAALAAAGLRRSGWRHAAVAALAAAAAFVLGTPYLVLDWPGFWAGFSGELFKQGQASGTLFDQTGNGVWYLLATNLPFALGVPLLVLAAAGIEPTLAAHRRALGTLSAHALPCAALLALATMRFLRYTLPLLPLLCVLAGVAAASARRPLTRAASVLALLAALLLSAAQSLTMTGADPRDHAARWVAETTAPADRIGLVHAPAFWTPPVSVHNGGAFSADGFAEDQRQGRIVVTGWDVDELRRKDPSVVLLSEFEWREEERLGNPKAIRFLAELESRYTREAVFHEWPAAWRQVFTPRAAPHDWLYPFADVRCYRRR
jgi:4-amino-4-deoxy-L-arabinose transferase-like glycosyltransferase